MNQINVIILNLFLLFVNIIQINGVYLRNISASSAITFYNGRLQVLKQNLNLEPDASLQCRVITEESRKPWDEPNVKEVKTNGTDNILYLMQTTPDGCLNFDVRSERVTIVLTDPKYLSIPRYAISLNLQSILNGVRFNYSVIQKQIPTSNNMQIEITPGILDGSKYKSFSLNWGDGKISITEDNKPLPFLSLSDPDIKENPLILVGLKSFGTSTTSWRLKNLEKKCGEEEGPITNGTIQTVLVQCWSWNI